MKKVDIIGRINGEFGKWQFRTVLIIFLTKIPSAWFMACIIFTGKDWEKKYILLNWMRFMLKQ